jgi:ADP-ribose pyrophosphatase YjhB (NUDIX family)
MIKEGYHLPLLAVSVAVIQGDQVLLTMRDDFHVWCLPSGGVEEGETIVDAALRETHEETGLEVKLNRFVGIYSRIGAVPDIHAVHFSASPIRGELRTQPGETIEVRYFPIDNLPTQMVFGHKRRIIDSTSDPNKGKVVVQRFRNDDAEPISIEELLRLRDDSDISSSDFYMGYFGDRLIGDDEFVPSD